MAIGATALTVGPGAVIVLRSSCAIVLVIDQSSAMVAMIGATVCCGPFMVAGNCLVIRVLMTVFVGVGVAVAGVGRC